MKKVLLEKQFEPEQVCKAYATLRFLKNYGHTVVFNEQCKKTIVDQFLGMISQCQVKNFIDYGDRLRLLAKPETVNLALFQKIAIEIQLGEEIEDKCTAYKRFMYKNLYFHSYDDKKLKKRRNDSTALTLDGKLISIWKLLKVRCVASKATKYVIVGKELPVLDESLCVKDNFNSKMYSYIAVDNTRLACSEVSFIENKCLSHRYRRDKLCIFPLVNMLETD